MRRSGAFSSSVVAGRLLVAAGAGGLAALAAAQPVFRDVPSLELRVERSDLIVRGRIAEVEPIGEGGKRRLVTLAVAETLKGPDSRRVTFTVPVIVDEEAADLDRLARSPSVVAFLRAARAPSFGDSGLDAGTVPYDILDTAAKGPVRVLALDLRPIRGAGDLSRRVREMASRPRRATGGTHLVGLSAPQTRKALGEAADFLVWARLEVPVDERLERRALAWIASQDDDLRIEGVRALRYFESEANVRRLRSLLSDPLRKRRTTSDDEVVDYYPVREAAAAVLERWGVSTAPARPSRRERSPSDLP